MQGKTVPNLSHSNLIFLPQLPIWPFYECLKLVWWRESFLCCNASQKKVMVQEVWLKGTEYEVVASRGEERSNSERGCEHVRGGC